MLTRTDELGELGEAEGGEECEVLAAADGETVSTSLG
jgi:hypothetical protein